jgi:hypothetical protein
VLAALLPRTAQLKVVAGMACCLRGADTRLRCRPCGGVDGAVLHRAEALTRTRSVIRGQVTSGGDMLVVSGVGAKGTSRMTLSGGKGLGPDGAQRLADLLCEAPSPMLAEMDLRCFANIPFPFNIP